MKKTQPLITVPEPRREPAPINLAPTVAEPEFDEEADLAPMPLCWGLLATSALVLIIQIWNYFA